MPRPSVLVLHNTPAPYRLPLFDALLNEFDLEVAFCQIDRSVLYDRRLWQVKFDGYRFPYYLLNSTQVNLWGKRQLLNLKLISHVLQRPYDVYILGHGPGMLPTLLMVMLVAKMKGCPMILWSGMTHPCEKTSKQQPTFWQKVLSSTLYRWPSAYIAYGERATSYLQNFGVRREQIYAGTQVIWPEQLPLPSRSRSTLGLEGRKVVLTVSYLVEAKGIQFLIDAFQSLKRDDAILVIAGDGPYRSALEAQAVDPNILFVGYVEGSMKTSYYAAADIFVLPTLFDSWGLVINEAMHFGLPIITTYGAGCSELQKENALVVAPKDVAAMANALQKVLDDDDLRQQMGQASRRLIQNYYGATAVQTFRQALHAVYRPHSESTVAK